VDAAERLLMSAHDLLEKAGLGNGSDALFWQDPFSTDGLLTAEKIRPWSHDVRIAAESALVYIAQRREAGWIANPDALDAMELGARRMDLIGMKFQIADQVRDGYARAVDSTHKDNARELGDISGVNGRFQDLRDAYAITRSLYEAAWRAENRPYWIQNVLVKYDVAMQLWQSRADRFAQARSELARTKKLPSAAAVGIPPSPSSGTPLPR
jgi:hypothetical protein